MNKELEVDLQRHLSDAATAGTLRCADTKASAVLRARRHQVLRQVEDRARGATRAKGGELHAAGHAAPVRVVHDVVELNPELDVLLVVVLPERHVLEDTHVSIPVPGGRQVIDRKSTRLNSSHLVI